MEKIDFEARRAARESLAISLYFLDCVAVEERPQSWRMLAPQSRKYYRQEADEIMRGRWE